MIKKIIGIAGHAESGKTTFAKILKTILEKQNQKVLLINYGDFVKFVAREYYGWNGEKDEAGRTLLQKVGTELGRGKVGENIWVDMVISTTQLSFEDYDYAIVADCRFPNEYNRWIEKNLEIIKVNMFRPNHENKLTEEQRLHESETALDDYGFDYIIECENVEELKESAETFIKEIQ